MHLAKPEPAAGKAAPDGGLPFDKSKPAPGDARVPVGLAPLGAGEYQTTIFVKPPRQKRFKVGSNESSIQQGQPFQVVCGTDVARGQAQLLHFFTVEGHVPIGVVDRTPKPAPLYPLDAFPGVEGHAGLAAAIQRQESSPEDPSSSQHSPRYTLVAAGNLEERLVATIGFSQVYQSLSRRRGGPQPTERIVSRQKGPCA